MRKRKCVVCGYEYLTHEIFIRGDIPTDGVQAFLIIGASDDIVSQ